MAPQPTQKLRHKSSGLRSLLGRFHEQSRETIPSLSIHSPEEPQATPPQISKFVLGFVNSMDTEQLSNFLAWFLHYDVVELPESPASWYSPMCSMEMRAWIALGAFLSKTTEYGFDLVVLDSICDRLRLRRAVVHGCLIQLSDPQKMAWTQLATIINEAKLAQNPEVETLELVQAKLHDLNELAQRIKPTEGSMFAAWRSEILERLCGFLTQVLAPRISHHRLGTTLVTNATSVQVPKEVKGGLRLNFLYEAMQQERQVPLVRYGIFPDSPPGLTPAGSSAHDEDRVSILDEDFIEQECQIERSYSVTKLRAENRALRAENAELRNKNQNLVHSNEKLARKFAMLGRVQPALYTRPDWNNSEPITPIMPDSNAHVRPQSSMLEVPLPCMRPRSLSDGDTRELSA
ncbi:hypothetical protein BU26DRAFT_442974, partial [Trematosphaeria pertusa]